MIQSIIENIIATAICTVFAATMRRLYRQHKHSKNSTQVATGAYSKKLVHHQFFLCLFILTFALPIAFILPKSTGMIWMLLKFLLFISSGFAFIFAWGAFEAAFAFYPDDESWPDKPAKDASENAGDH